MTSKDFIAGVLKKFDSQPTVAHSEACAESPMKECNENCPYKLTRDFLTSSLEEAFRVMNSELQNSCPVITDMKSENGYLWVKIPEFPENTSFRILPESVFAKHEKEMSFISK